MSYCYKKGKTAIKYDNFLKAETLLVVKRRFGKMALSRKGKGPKEYTSEIELGPTFDLIVEV